MQAGSTSLASDRDHRCPEGVSPIAAMRSFMVTCAQPRTRIQGTHMSCLSGAALRSVATAVFPFAFLTMGDTRAADPIGISDVTYTALQTEPNANLLCHRGIETAWLKRDGSVSVARRGCSFDQSIPVFLTDRKSTRLNSSHSQISYA